MTVKWGILSTARINDAVLAAAQDCTNVAFTAVASRDRENAAAYAEQRGIALSYGSYEALVADRAVDAVYISLPNSMHVEWAAKCLKAGKHVLCEKPLGRDVKAVMKAASLADRHDLVLAEAFMFRFHPQTARLRRLIADGVIGVLRHIAATLSFSMRPRENNPRLSAALHGGAMMDVGCYCVCMARLIAGEPYAAWASSAREGSEVDLRSLGALRFENDVTAHFDVGMNLPRRDRVEVVGTEGFIVVDDPWHCRLPSFQLARPSAPLPGLPPPRDGVREVAIDGNGRHNLRHDLLDTYRLQLATVTEAIESGQPLEFASRDAVAQARVLDALLRSAETGETVRIGDVR